MFRQKLVPLLSNIALILLAYLVCRVIYFLINYDYFSHLSFIDHLQILRGGIRYDLSSICYTNALYILLATLPIHGKLNVYNSILKYLFIIVNGVAVIMNIMDSVMYPYVNHRFTASLFTEFGNESNLGSIVGKEALHYWYLILAAGAILYLLYKGYRKIPFSKIPYYQSVGLLLLSIALLFTGIRGTLNFDVRPLALRNAKEYVKKTTDINLVLNSPYTIIRTMDKQSFKIPAYYTDAKKMEKVFCPVHYPCKEKKDSCNVIILMLESFSSEFSGYLNDTTGYMPFIDSLMKEGLTYTYSYANGRSSIDAQVSILSGIPKFVESFMNSHAAMDKVTSIGGELKKAGYHTSYFHGANNGSLGIESYVKLSGMEHYYGRNEYNNDQDFDGVWGIWDEKFLQFAAKEMNTFKQPFFTTIFTVTSHNPFQIPQEYKGVFQEGTLPIHKCIRYTDYSVRKFFETVSKEDWYKNTLFVITGDHTTITEQKEYQTENGYFKVPIIFYHPGNDTFKGRKEGIAQHIDIMPTVLDYIGVDYPYISFGTNLLNTPDEDTYAVNYNGNYLYMQKDLLLIFNGTSSCALYNIKEDPLLNNNLIDSNIEDKERMEVKLKAIIQDYMTRMVENKLVLQ